MLPETYIIPENLLKEIDSTESEYYEIENIPVLEVLNNNFIEGFIKKGK